MSAQRESFLISMKHEAQQERAWSGPLLQTKEKYGSPAYGIELEEATNDIRFGIGAKLADAFAVEAPTRNEKRRLLVESLRQYGCLILLEQLNKSYGLLTLREFDLAASASGQAPSELGRTGRALIDR